MAEKRMFSRSIIQSDAFTEMPLSAQALYFHLGLEADDDGFLGNVQRIVRVVNASQDDFKLLIAKRFVIVLQDGVCVIRHWKAHNYIRSDRYKPTIYEQQRASLYLTGAGIYTLEKAEIMASDAVSIPSDNHMGVQPGAQYSIEEIRLNKKRVSGAIEIAESACTLPPVKHKRGEFGYVKLTDEEYNRLVADLGEQEVQRVIAYVDESAATTKNKNRWKDWNLVLRKAHREGWGLNRRSRPQPVKVDPVEAEVIRAPENWCV